MEIGRGLCAYLRTVFGQKAGCELAWKEPLALGVRFQRCGFLCRFVKALKLSPADSSCTLGELSAEKNPTVTSVLRKGSVTVNSDLHWEINRP